VRTKGLRGRLRVKAEPPRAAQEINLDDPVLVAYTFSVGELGGERFVMVGHRCDANEVRRVETMRDVILYMVRHNATAHLTPVK
jgi:hypothetical protein